MRMTHQPRIFVAGHRGMVGSAIVRALLANGHTNLVTRTHAELDLTNQAAVRAFFQSERIDQVYLAAAKVGGIHANNTYPAEFIHQNLMIQTNVIHEAWQAGINKLLFLGSSCIYPRDCPQPIKEEYLLTGPLEPTNEPYAIAKIAGLKMCESYNRQFGTDYRCIMPCNLYGPGDNYDLANSHVIPAMMRKFHLAKLAQEGNISAIITDQQCHGQIPPDIKAMIGLDAETPITIDSNITPKASVQLWGTGKPLREFLHVDDLAEAAIVAMNLNTDKWLEITLQHPSRINVGFGSDLPVRDVAEIVAHTVGYSGHIEFDAIKPDGTLRKLMSSQKLTQMGWQARILLKTGIQNTYAEYRQ
jgi:GDP-L-fucose synthase